MKSNPARVLPAAAAAALLAAPPAAVSAASSSELADLAAHALTLDEFESIRASQSPVDFGGLASKGETDKLWSDAIAFEYEVATSHASDLASTSVAYHPYVVCSTYPDKSGLERVTLVNEMFNISDIEDSDMYSGDVFLNNDDMSCAIVRAYNDTMAKAFSENPGVEEYVTVTPIHPSMKIAQITVDVLQGWFSGGDSGEVVTISEAAEPGGLGQVEVKSIGLDMLLCPGVQEFGGVDVPDDEIATDVAEFVTGNGGATVRDLSFYYHRVSGEDGETALHTTAMDLWSQAISQVANNWTMADGSNPCLDTILGENMVYEINGDVLNVDSKIFLPQAIELAASLNYSTEDLGTCIYYMTYGLALSPQVCTLEPQTRVKTLCEDLTEDLDKCPIAVPSPTPPPYSSAEIGTAPWRNIVALVALSLSFAVGVDTL